jgi:hypothetical protein
VARAFSNRSVAGLQAELAGHVVDAQPRAADQQARHDTYSVIAIERMLYEDAA